MWLPESRAVALQLAAGAGRAPGLLRWLPRAPGSAAQLNRLPGCRLRLLFKCSKTVSSFGKMVTSAHLLTELLERLNGLPPTGSLAQRCAACALAVITYDRQAHFTGETTRAQRD